jgi:transposase
MPISFFVTEGQRHECKIAPYLLARKVSETVIGDKAYDTNELRKALESQHKTCVIPFRKCRKYVGEFDADLYQSRQVVECLICRMKNYRRIATRYEKLAVTYQAMIIISFILICLRF